MEIEEIGIIGTGDMGKLYARKFAGLGYTVNACDVPERREQLERDFEGTKVRIFDNGAEVARSSDLTFYLVPVENVEDVVSRYGPATRKHGIVSAGTSVMTPAIDVFQRYLPADVNIINWHWLFGPTLDPRGQPSAVVRHRSSDDAYREFRDVIDLVKTNVVELSSYQEHDKITADTQAVTHIGFESMGTAWKNMGNFPWENPAHIGRGIDNVKVLMCLRIYAGKPHVYSGLAIFNPYAREQIQQYSRSVSELFGLMIQEREDDLRDRITEARDFFFTSGGSPILLDDSVMGEFSLGIPTDQRKPNSHLSLLGMIDSWHQMKINPYSHMVCQTPPFRLRLGIAEHLLRNKELLEESIKTASSDKSIRRDDLAFHSAVHEWATIVRNGDSTAYRRQFEDTRAFFESRLKEGVARSTELIKRLR